MATEAHTTHRKTRWSTSPLRPSAGAHAQPYRRRRPETTTLHRIVREHLETYLALANEADPTDPLGDGVPDHVEKEFRDYLRCGLHRPLPALPMCRPAGPYLRGLPPDLPDLRYCLHLHRLCLPLLPSPRHPFGELRFAPVLTDPEPISQILAHIGEPTSPPLIHPARGPPQTELDMGPGQPKQDELARDSLPVDFDQSPEFDPADPEPIPEDHFDQSRDA